MDASVLLVLIVVVALLFEFANGDLGISTRGGFSGTGASGSNEDVMRFAATSTGSVTTGSFTRYFDGSDVGFGGSSSDDLDAVRFDANGDLIFSSVGIWTVSGRTRRPYGPEAAPPPCTRSNPANRKGF